MDYSGAIGTILHNPNLPVRESMTKEEYRKREKSAAINHFYEKLLKLKDLMNTRTGYKMALERHRFMESFLAEFYAEWDGER